MQKIKSIVFVAMLHATAGAFAGAEGRGGGQVIDVNSTPELLDLVTSSVCRYESGEDLLAEHPDFEKRVIEPLRKLDWYFANAILRDVKNLKFCFTGALKFKSQNDIGSPVKGPSRLDVTQAGYRYNDKVYVDDGFYSNPLTPERTRDYFTLHEELHSFLPETVEFRKLKLRSMVKTVKDVELGKIASRAKLHYDMGENEIDFPLSVDDLDSHREAIEFLFAEGDQQTERLSHVSEIDSVLDLPSDVIEKLTIEDQKFLKNNTPLSLTQKAFANLLISASPQEFLELVRSDKFKRLDPLSVAIANLDYLSREDQAALWSTDLQKTIFDRTYGNITQASFLFDKDAKTCLDSRASHALGVERGGATPLLDLPVPGQLPEGLRAIADGLVWNVKAGHWDWVSSLAGKQSPLVSVLKLEPLTSQIEKVNFAYRPEGKFVSRRLKSISQELTLLFKDYIKNQLNDDQYVRLSEIIF